MSCKPNEGWCPPPITGPVVTFIKRVKEALLIIPNCGVWYKEISDRLEKIKCLLECDGDTITSTVAASDETTLIREQNVLARKTAVLNVGESRAMLYEGGRLVGIVQPDDTWISPLAGRQKIQAICDSGETTTLVVTTYLRCDCEIAPVFYDDFEEPTGGGLI